MLTAQQKAVECMKFRIYNLKIKTQYSKLNMFFFVTRLMLTALKKETNDYFYKLVIKSIQNFEKWKVKFNTLVESNWFLNNNV